jgi:deoxyadenosine/deoxycytidine kinase
LYYGDAVKYGLDMQLWLLRQRFIMYCRAIRALEETTTDANGVVTKVKGVVLDRSLMSDVVFADKVDIMFPLFCDSSTFFSFHFTRQQKALTHIHTHIKQKIENRI